MKLPQRAVKNAGWLLLFGAIIYFPIFLHLTSLPIQLWDESHLAINSTEMLRSGNIIVTQYDGLPDMWNTKPPLMIWLEALSIKIIGLNELAVRLPAALAAVGVCLLLLWLSKKYFRQYSLGFIGVLVLITSNGYIIEHVTRTGDYDSFITFLSACVLFSFFSYTESENRDRGKWALAFFISLTLAVLCKGVVGLLFLPAIGIYALIRKQVIPSLRTRNFYTGIFIFLIFGAGYYLLRELLNPGYLKAVMQNEVGGRFLHTIENHQAPFGFYFNDLFTTGFKTWILLVPCGWIIGLFHKDIMMRRLTLLVVLCTLSYLLIISMAQTKLVWYAAPAYPLLAFSVAVFLNWIFELLNGRDVFRSDFYKPVAGYVMLFLLFVTPYYNMVSRVYNTEIPDWTRPQYDIPEYLKHALENNIVLDGSKLIFDHPPSSNLFYKKVFARRNQDITFSSVNELNEGDRVIISQDNLYDNLLQRFTVDTVALFKHVRIVRLDHRK